MSHITTEGLQQMSRTTVLNDLGDEVDIRLGWHPIEEWYQVHVEGGLTHDGEEHKRVDNLVEALACVQREVYAAITGE